MRPADVTTTVRPVKPYDGFPMNVHPNGQWCKRINGTLRYFGNGDWRPALARFNRESPYWYAGQTPPAESFTVVGSTTHPPTVPNAGPTLDEVGTRFWARELKRQRRGDICLESYLDTRRAVTAMFDHLGRKRRLLLLTPDDWADFRHFLLTEPDPKDKSRRRRGVDSLGRAISYIRAMLSWAEENVLQPGQPVRTGDSFDRVPKSEKWKSRRKSERKNGARIFTPDQIGKIAAECPVVLRAMFLLGLNGGYGAVDLSSMPLDVIDLDAATIEYDRVKTGVPRIVTLWPRTVEALRVALPLRPKAKPGYEAHAFLTRCGVPFCRSQAVEDEDGNPINAKRANAVAGEFTKVLTALGMKRPGLNFYAVRHTFRTAAGMAGDEEATDFIMGHSMGESAEWYIRPDIARLRIVTDHVERTLFGYSG